MSRRIPLLVVIATLAAGAPRAAAQDLPEYTSDQRWARTEYMANAWVVMGIRYAKSKGESVDQFTQAVFEAFDPGWSMEYGPQEIMRAMRRNWLTYRAGEMEVLESSPERVHFRVNRPYTAFFGESGEVFGVTLADYQRMMGLFHENICAKRGMTYQESVEGDWVTITIAKR